ncbi:DUF421 domain-containing protein [Brevundimonas goettingensis]|uniref:YetF C-terminal domain-containing protein n=1 Tax=Brevundimonas goettingensis TaxID=2774190 RepID=A0A975BZY9_9CAUL|nr:YetF domain-containing protein [Brevundimonas goettingensis]QTC90257.1 hypothetical protein IFJ75_13335 [Brevundimonas goettingensis]
MIDALQGEGIGPACARAALSFIIAWALLKAGKKRFLKQGSPFDALLAIMTGAVLGRGVTEGGAFYPALAAAAVITLSHWGFASLAFHVPGMSRVIEGHPRTLMQNGRPDPVQMRRALVSEDDLREELRLRTGSDDLGWIDAAWQERSGRLSLRLKPGAPP